MLRNLLPDPSIERLCSLYGVIEDLIGKGYQIITSKELELLTSIKAHTIRKDLSCIEGKKTEGQKYNIIEIKKLIESGLCIDIKRKSCIVGVGRLGSAILNYGETAFTGFEIAAAFDSNINRIEMMKTHIPLFPAYEIEERVREMSIELGVITVPEFSAQSVADKLIAGGVKGIVNFAPAIIKNDKPGVYIRNVYVKNEFRILSAFISLKKA